MSEAPAIAAYELSKRYRLGTRRSGSFRDTVSNAVSGLWKAEKASPFWALKDVSFEVEQGEVMGIIGRNGAGKSTLLKILSRITAPTEGRVEINGRVSSLLEVGTGFHPELTGRENIYMNGAILGMRRAEIRKKFDEIVAFSGIEQFLDTPVKRYSSGMYVRLAFAVAAHLEPEILIIDEVLAVGDAEFQKKCLGKMKDVSEQQGRTVLFVSHNMGAIAELCSRGLLMRGGQVIFDGKIDELISNYTQQQGKTAEDQTKVEDKELFISQVRLLNKSNQTASTFQFEDSLQVVFDFINRSLLKEIDIGLAIRDFSGKKLFTTVHRKNDLNTGENQVSVRIPGSTLLQGHYTADVALFNSQQLFDYHEHKLSLVVTDDISSLRDYKSVEIGSIHVSCEWN